MMNKAEKKLLMECKDHFVWLAQVKEIDILTSTQTLIERINEVIISDTTVEEVEEMGEKEASVTVITGLIMSGLILDKDTLRVSEALSSEELGKVVDRAINIYEILKEKNLS